MLDQCLTNVWPTLDQSRSTALLAPPKSFWKSDCYLSTTFKKPIAAYVLSKYNKDHIPKRKKAPHRKYDKAYIDIIFVASKGPGGVFFA